MRDCPVSPEAESLLAGHLDRSVEIDPNTALWAATLAAVNAADPVGMGWILDEIPDEYEPEIHDLCRLHLAGALSPDTAWAVFVHWFSEGSLPERGNEKWKQIVKDVTDAMDAEPDSTKT